MKIIRNIARRPWPRIGGWLPVMMLICGVLASCSSEDESTAPLPDGKYPLQLTAEVAQPQTRAGGKDAWTGGEEIRVSLEGVFGNKTYVMDASGNASPKDADNAFYWKNTDEARVSAWTPDIESETDISDQSGGYAAFDVLYASAIGRYDQAINLRFIHRMAKIEVILKAGEGITEEELEGATVTIFGDPLTHSTAGLVSPGDQSDGEIKPYYDAATKKYEALVPPQDMTGKRVMVTLGPTREAWDGVRFWSNPSSGLMGAALAVCAWLRGAEVTAVCGPGVRTRMPQGIARRDVVSARDMFAVAANLWPQMDVGMFTAAVAEADHARQAINLLPAVFAQQAVGVLMGAH